MNIIGIDPGSTHAGVCRLDEGVLVYGAQLDGPSGWPPWNRSDLLADKLAEIVHNQVQDLMVNLICIEHPSANRRGPGGVRIGHATTMTLGMAYGATRRAVEDAMAGFPPVIGVPANVWTVGKNRGKQTVLEFAGDVLGPDPIEAKPDVVSAVGMTAWLWRTIGQYGVEGAKAQCFHQDDEGRKAKVRVNAAGAGVDR